MFLGVAVVRRGFAPEWPTVPKQVGHQDFIVNSLSHSTRKDWTTLGMLKGVSVAVWTYLKQFNNNTITVTETNEVLTMGQFLLSALHMD